MQIVLITAAIAFVSVLAPLFGEDSRNLDPRRHRPNW